jgi:hypothetical protein
MAAPPTAMGEDHMVVDLVEPRVATKCPILEPT